MKRLILILFLLFFCNLLFAKENALIYLYSSKIKIDDDIIAIIIPVVDSELNKKGYSIVEYDALTQYQLSKTDKICNDDCLGKFAKIKSVNKVFKIEIKEIGKKYQFIFQMINTENNSKEINETAWLNGDIKDGEAVDTLIKKVISEKITEKTDVSKEAEKLLTEAKAENLLNQVTTENTSNTNTEISTDNNNSATTVEQCLESLGVSPRTYKIIETIITDKKIQLVIKQLKIKEKVDKLKKELEELANKGMSKLGSFGGFGGFGKVKVDISSKSNDDSKYACLKMLAKDEDTFEVLKLISNKTTYKLIKKLGLDKAIIGSMQEQLAGLPEDIDEDDAEKSILLGLKAGLGINFYCKDFSCFNHGSFAFTTGGFFSKKASILKVQAEVLFTYKSFEYGSSGVKQYSFDIPFLLGLNFSGLGLYFGGYFSQLFKLEDSNKNLSSNWGGIFGIEYLFGPFLLDLRYSHDFISYFNEISGKSIFNQNIILSVGYVF